jgi:uncharacterized membrane protein YedE/YeeE
MSSIRDMILANPAAWLAIGGLVIGVAFGYIVFRTNFCTMGSISDIVSFGDYRRFRAWLLAGAVAIAGAQSLDAAEVVALSKSMYLGSGLNWVGNVIGGLMFGFGMVFAGGCASRNLARVGAGDLRSLMTLIVMGLFAYMTIGGLIRESARWPRARWDSRRLSPAWPWRRRSSQPFWSTASRTRASELRPFTSSPASELGCAWSRAGR